MWSSPRGALGGQQGLPVGGPFPLEPGRQVGASLASERGHARERERRGHMPGGSSGVRASEWQAEADRLARAEGAGTGRWDVVWGNGEPQRITGREVSGVSDSSARGPGNSPHHQKNQGESLVGRGRLLQ